MNDIEFIHADARHLPIEDDSVQCIVTSPPYWGLRKYSGEQELIWEHAEPRLAEAMLCAKEGHVWTERARNLHTGSNAGEKQVSNRGAFHNNQPTVDGTCARCGCWKGAYGLEPTIEMYVDHTVQILRELRRVLRPDGVLFWNIGDSYAGGGNYRGWDQSKTLSTKQGTNRGANELDQELGVTRERLIGLKPKDLCLIPERVALAAQADGWWVRSRILWCKPNPMPESVTDRPTDAAEHIWMFTKSERYFWDADAVREPADPANIRKDKLRGPKNQIAKENGQFSDSAFNTGFTGSRNMRNVWTFATQPYSGAHFAAFPEELPRRCILAATSAKGACIQCGAPWERMTSRSWRFESGSGKAGNPPAGKNGEDYEQAQSGDYDIRMGPVVDSQTIGWSPTCKCRGQRGKTVPCLVLDPFAGSGTVGRVAVELNCRVILNDLAYHDLSEKRTTNVQRSLAF